MAKRRPCPYRTSISLRGGLAEWRSQRRVETARIGRLNIPHVKRYCLTAFTAVYKGLYSFMPECLAALTFCTYVLFYNVGITIVAYSSTIGSQTARYCKLS